MRRIKEAKEYKRDRESQLERPAPLPEAPREAAELNEEQHRLDEQVAAFGQKAAAKEEEVLTSALENLQRQGSPAVEPLGPQRSSDRKAPSDGASLRLAAMRRIEAARKYTASKTTASPSGSIPAVSAASPSTHEQEVEGTEWGRSSVGSAEEAAPFLREIVQKEASSGSKELSAEQFTLAKEMEQRERGAEIITIDSGASVSGAEGAYKPKVATWGVFPRPSNISREYGGGRTIRPGEALEPEAATLARKKRVAEALSTYKKNAGLEVDPASEAAAQEAYNRGMELMQRGQLTAALQPFDEALGFVSFRTRIGGEATLQKAICLDSLRRADEAMSLYKQLQRHSAPGVAKKAKQMLFGFTSMDYLKTHTISYSVQRGAYDEYFTKLTGQWNNMYSSEGEEDDGSLTVATVMATAVMMAPLVLVGVKLGARLLK
ncbi:hypothetical protein COCOBI_04-3140 [Coccomyxa sp. Obi]|nr:hypothetical protein COCOBI_04-3140 [Coccomyxa sp. Obi]